MNYELFMESIFNNLYCCFCCWWWNFLKWIMGLCYHFIHSCESLLYKTELISCCDLIYWICMFTNMETSFFFSFKKLIFCWVNHNFFFLIVFVQYTKYIFLKMKWISILSIGECSRSVRVQYYLLSVWMTCLNCKRNL